MRPWVQRNIEVFFPFWTFCEKSVIILPSYVETESSHSQFLRYPEKAPRAFFYRNLARPDIVKDKHKNDRAADLCDP
jgi:hypothetical protein